MSDSTHEQYRPQEASPPSQHLAWQPSFSEYQQSNNAEQLRLNQDNQQLMNAGVIGNLEIDFGKAPLLAQATADRQSGHVSNTPDLDTIDPSKLSQDAQFGGAAGNWFRYLGRAAWHFIDGMSQPGATDNMIFGSSVRAGHYYTENNVQSVLNDIGLLSQDAMHTVWNAPGAFEKMTPEQKSQMSAEATFNAFFFVGAKAPIAQETAEQMGLKYMSREQLNNLAIESSVPTMKNGERLAFSTESGIEVTKATGEELNSIWRKGWSVRGFEGEDHMGNSGILARNFPTIDDGVFKNGVFTSFKTVDLNAATYQIPEKLESRLQRYLDKLNDWGGQERPWGGVEVDPTKVKERVLQIGVPAGAMTEGQVKVFESFGRRAQSLGIKVKLTVIE